METLVQLIFCLAILKYTLKAALAGRFLTIFFYAFAAAIWAVLWFPIVINQPVTIAAEFLGDKMVVTNAALLTTLEAIIGLMLSVRLLDNYFSPKVKRKKYLFLLKVTPGILFLLAIPYFELLFFKWRVAGSFWVTAVLFAGLTLGVLMSLAYGIKLVVLGESLKLEMKLLFNLIILFIGLLINASLVDYNVSTVNNVVEWRAMGVLFVFFVVLFGIGFMCSKINYKQYFKRK